jgi:hypothetical protein
MSRRTSNIVLFLLSGLLLASNAWWCYRSLDHGVTLTQMQVVVEDLQQALDQSLSLFPLLASEQAGKDAIIKNFETIFGLNDGFEKEGLFWIGRIGLRFDGNEKLIEVRRAWK